MAYRLEVASRRRCLAAKEFADCTSREPTDRDCAYLLAKELLHIVQFTEFDGLPTQVEFEHEKENRRKGTIKLKFSRNVILRPHSAYRFVYREPIDDNEGA